MARRRRVVLAGTGALAAVAIMAPVGSRVAPGGPVLSGLADGAQLRQEQLAELTVSGDEDVEVLVDGEPARIRREGDRMVLADPAIGEGAHTVTVREPVAFLPDREVSRSFTVDDTPPRIVVDENPVRDPRRPFTLTGRVFGASALTVDDDAVPIDEHGRFQLTLPIAPTTLRLVAWDGAGNDVAREHRVPVGHPPMRAVHLSALAWSSEALREPVLRLVAEGRIDTVQLDIKDENGEIGYRSTVALAKRIGATRGHYDAREALRRLHDAGVRVVGRIVAFRDPILAAASWRSGKRSRVVQTITGAPWPGSGGDYEFTNFADPDVVAYNVELAQEAAALGFDDILFDYVRRPTGALEGMRLPGLRGTPEQEIVDFLATSREIVRANGAFLGVSVSEGSVDRPTEVAQDIPAMARGVDYLAPMIYPSYRGTGEFGVDSPQDRPYEVTRRTLEAFAVAVRGSGAQVVPWLQAFSMHKPYGSAEIRTQIDAASATGATSFLLWNAGCRYDPAALEPAG
jgi:hypothetical protein